MRRRRHIGYFLRRLLYLPLSLLLLSLLCFLLIRLAPGDPVRQRMSAEGMRSTGQDPVAYARNYRQVASELGYDLPPFYFVVTNAAIPDTLYRIVESEHRSTVTTLAQRYGDWQAVQHYYHTLLDIAYHPAAHPPDLVVTARKLLLRAEPAYIAAQLDQLRESVGENLREAHRNMERLSDKAYILRPRLYFYGWGNQYHRYLTGLLQGDLGTSYVDRRSVAEKIGVALPRTLLLNGLALVVIYLLAVPLGLYMAYRAGSRFDRWVTVLTFLAFGIPSFWVATLLANFLTTPAFGLDYFPSMGFGNVPADASWLTALRVRGAHLVLPVFCLAYPSWAYVSRQLRTAGIAELGRPYVITARMKGMAGPQVLRKHVFRNAAFPLVTMLGGLLPALLAGSVLIEKIFNLPGMGLLLYNSTLARDWPVVMALVLVNGLLTIIGLLLADVGYLLLDPRVRLAKTPGR